MWWLLLLFSIGVAALIGGVTNHLAIKMLFFPYEEKRFLGWKIPFTPGIIPKRRHEIAISFGRIVSDHLITSDGIRRWLREPALREQINRALSELLQRWLLKRETLAEICLRVMDRASFERLQGKAAVELQRQAIRFFHEGWHEKQWGKRTLADLLGEWSEEQRTRISGNVIDYGFSQLEEALFSEGGERLLRSSVEQLLAGMTGGGFFGNMLGAMINPDSIVKKLQATISQKLAEASVRESAHNWCERRLAEWQHLPIEKVLSYFHEEEDGADFLEKWVAKQIDWSRAVALIFEQSPADWMAEHELQSMLANGKIVETLVNLLENHIEKLMESLQLARIVEAQVERFPIQQIERMILDVSGREFRAITWLGALLGGLIGLIQYVLLNLI